MNSSLLSVRQIAQNLNVSESFARTLCLRGEIVAMKLGRTWRVSMESLAAYMNRSRWYPGIVVTKPADHNHVTARFNRARRETA